MPNPKGGFFLGFMLILITGQCVAASSCTNPLACMGSETVINDYYFPTTVGGDVNPELSGCLYYSKNCYNLDGGIAVITCTSCQTNYVLTQKSINYSGCTFNFNICQSNCTGCMNCTSDADWSAYGTGYQKKTTKSCSCNTCNSSTTYRCAAGYYGLSHNGTSGCEICPTGGTSVAGDNTTISKCYASPPNGSDYSGNWQFMQTCYYTGQ
ncbi:MAG: hypothetical protein LBD50_01355 [Rickettsiales bacterium]|jgi:hypothetical protein|nr:hypothetical protein [Rickettsiales bacterium]